MSKFYVIEKQTDAGPMYFRYPTHLLDNLFKAKTIEEAVQFETYDDAKVAYSQYIYNCGIVDIVCKFKPTKIYLAAGWFTPNQARREETLRNIIKSHSEYVGFFPREKPLEENVFDEKVRKAIFDLDCKEIDNADCVIAITNEKDMGTLFECGYAYKAGKPVFYIFETDEIDAKFNIMLAESAVRCFTSFKQIDEALTDGTLFNQKKWMGNVE